MWNESRPRRGVFLFRPGLHPQVAGLAHNKTGTPVIQFTRRTGKPDGSARLRPVHERKLIRPAPLNYVIEVPNSSCYAVRRTLRFPYPLHPASSSSPLRARRAAPLQPSLSLASRRRDTLRGFIASRFRCFRFSSSGFRFVSPASPLILSVTVIVTDD